MPEERLATRLTFTVDRKEAPWGTEVTVMGALTDLAGWAVPNAPIEIQQLVAGRWETLVTCRTDALGRFSHRITLPQVVPLPARLMFRAHFPGMIVAGSPEIYEATTSKAATVGVTKRKAEITLDITSPTQWWDGALKVYRDVIGQMATASGKLTDAVTGAGLAGRTVTFEERFTPRTWTLTTATDGSWSHSFDQPVIDTGAYVGFIITFPGDAYYDRCYASTTWFIQRRTPVLSLTAPGSAPAGSTQTFSSNMVDPRVTTYGIPNKDIYLQESPDGVTWRDVAGPVTTDAAGKYSMSYTLPTTPGTYYYRTRFPGGSPPGQPVVEEAVSPPVMVKVLAPEEVPPVVVPWESLLATLAIPGLMLGIIVAQEVQKAR